MADSKAATRWTVNVIAFVLLALLTLTGLINWLLLPRGIDGGGGLLLSLRHSLRTIHQLSAVFFLGAVGVHLWLHWGYVTTQLKKWTSR